MTLFAHLEKLMGRFSRVGEAEFFDPEAFPWTRFVGSYYPIIREEMERVLATKEIPNFQDICPAQSVNSTDDGWKTFFLYAYGQRMKSNCAYCPHTDYVLSKIPGMKTAFFSILAPGKRLPMHRGPYKGVLRYHLGLQCPPAQLSGIKVGDEIRSWQEGESLIFDDTHFHRAWNLSSEPRVILFVDFLRPLPFPLNLINRAVVRYIRSTEFVQYGARKLNK